MLLFLSFWYFVVHISSYARHFALDRGRPSGHSSRGGLDSIRAVCRAWRALKLFFRLLWIRRFPPGGIFRRCFVPGILHFSKCWCFLLILRTYLFENGTACRNSGFPVLGLFRGTLSSKLGRDACRVPCVKRACAACNAMLFFFPNKKQKQAAGPNSLSE